jgi:hypothetical protein
MSRTVLPEARRAAIARRDAAAVAATGVAFALAVGLVVPTLRTIDHVPEVTVENPHPWTVDVGSDGDRVPVGAVHRERTQTFAELPDQGDGWSFTFGYAGQRAEVRLTAAELESADWTVTVPDGLAADLRAAGVAETPP